jgi:hypothetical protein
MSDLEEVKRFGRYGAGQYGVKHATVADVQVADGVIVAFH